MQPMKLSVLLVLLLVSGARAETMVITADRMFDAETGKVSGPVRIVVSDGILESVNPDLVPANAQLIELGDRTLMPGLLDMHTHLTSDYFTDDYTTKHHEAVLAVGEGTSR